MDPEDAKKLIAEVCAAYNGPLQAHQRIQLARRTLGILTAIEVQSNGHQHVEETVEA